MWKTVCCEVQGIGHKRARLPCQDRTHALSLAGTDIIVLADGAGSAKFSHYGAERVVQCVANYVAEHFQDCFDCADGREVARRILGLVAEELRQEALKHGCETRDLASTLLLAAVHGERFILAHVGDGVIGYLDGTSLKVASTPENGEFANETTFVTSANAERAMRLYKGTLREKCAFVLMSDGTEQSLFHKRTKTLAPVIVKLMHRVCLVKRDVLQKQMEEALSSVIAKNTQDDCSLAILARESASLCPIEALAYEERRELFQIASEPRRGHNRGKRRVARYDAMLAFLTAPHTLAQVAARIRLKPKHTRKQLNRLLELGLICRKGDFYMRG